MLPESIRMEGMRFHAHFSAILLVLELRPYWKYMAVYERRALTQISR